MKNLVSVAAICLGFCLGIAGQTPAPKTRSTARKFRRALTELSWLLPVSVAAGFLIGTAQHFVSFGVWGYGFGKDAVELALLEGGITGAGVGIPTGIVAYYFALRREASVRRVSLVLAGALIAGCALGAVLFWPSAFLTPVVAVVLARWVARSTALSH